MSKNDYNARMGTTWKLRDYLHDRRIKPAALARAMDGKMSRTAVYGLVQAAPPKAIYLETLDAVLPALREITGEDVEIGDLLEYVGPPAPMPQKKAWRKLIGALSDPDSPGDVSVRHDDYLAVALETDHAGGTLAGTVD